MKKITSFLLLATLLGCSSKPECSYSQLQILSQVEGKPLDTKNLTGCFTLTKGDMGLIEINDADGRIKVSFYEEAEPLQLKFLNIKFGTNKPVEFRANKGHNLYISNQKDTLGIIFGDRTSEAGRVSGSIILTK
jgi:hypothetical protein